MDPVSIALGLGKVAFIAVVGVAAWGFLRDYLSQVLVPVVRNRVSASLADALVKLIQVLDNVNSLAQQAVAAAFRKAYGLVRSTILRAEAVYQKVSPTEVKQTTVLYTADGDRVQETRVTSDLAWHDVPTTVKKQWLEQEEGTAARVVLSEQLLNEIGKKVPKEMLL